MDKLEQDSNTGAHYELPPLSEYTVTEHEWLVVEAILDDKDGAEYE